MSCAPSTTTTSLFPGAARATCSCAGVTATWRPSWRSASSCSTSGIPPGCVRRCEIARWEGSANCPTYRPWRRHKRVQVTMERPDRILCEVSDTQLFRHLNSVWELRPGPRPRSTWVHLHVDFAFRNQLYQQASVYGWMLPCSCACRQPRGSFCVVQAATVFFDEVVRRQIAAFESRCRILYGPAFGGPPAKMPQ